MTSQGTFAPAAAELALLTGPTPAAGAQPTYTVPANYRIQILTIHTIYSPDPLTGNRKLYFEAYKGLTQIVRIGTYNPINAGLVNLPITLAPGLPLMNTADTTATYLNIPSLILDPNDSVTLLPLFLAAPDQFGPFHILANCWIRP